MKIRNGFVSNSSSSSFMIAGFPVNVKDITINDLDLNTYIVQGKSLNDGDDVFYLSTNEMLYFVKSAKELYDEITDDMKDLDKFFSLNFSVYRVIPGAVICDNECDYLLDLEKLPKTGKIAILDINQDYNSSQDIERLFDSYIYQENIDEEFKRIYNKYLRKDKLKKIKRLNEKKTNCKN
jgi:hypothetical protein